MKKKTETLLAIMHVLAWLAFVGFMIKAAAILTSYVVSLVNPEAVKNMYEKLNLSGVRELSFLHYSAIVSLMFAIPAIEAYTAYLMIRVLSRIKMVNPFKIEIASLLERVSYFILTTWILAVIHNVYLKWLSEHAKGVEQKYLSLDFIFFAAIVFVIAQIFMKGVEIQSENELTV